MLIRKIDRYCTNIDTPDSPETIATELRGLIPKREGMIAERDAGTVHRYATPPIRPNEFEAITGAANNGSGLIRITCTGHGYSTSDVVYIDEVAGTIEAKGKWTITKIDNNTFDLVGSAFSNAYTSGGIATKTPITIIDGYTFVDTDGTEYDIVIGLDSNTKMRIYVYDSGWSELTRKIDALINGAPGATATTFNIDTITENAVTLALGTNTVQYYIVVNTTRSNQTLFITSSTASSLTVPSQVGSSGLGWGDNDVLEIYRFPAMKFNYNYSNGATPRLRYMEVRDQRKIALLYAHTDGTKRQAIQVMKRDARNYFYDGSAYGMSIPAGWYIESDFGILNPFYINEGSIESPITTYNSVIFVSGATNASPIEVTVTGHSFATDDYVCINGITGNTAANGIYKITKTGANTFTLNGSQGNGAYVSGGQAYLITPTDIYDTTSNRNWMTLGIGRYSAGTENSALRLMVVVEFSNYQTSDPIFGGYYYFSNANAYLELLINFALMNKEVSRIFVFMATANSTLYSAGWNEAFSDYYLVKTVYVQNSDTSTLGTNPWMVQGQKTGNDKAHLYQGSGANSSTSVSYAQQSALTTLSDFLNHEVDKTRTYPTPRFAVKVARPQGAVSVIDVDDKTLRAANRNGDNINEDDNYPDRTIDNEASKLILFLNSSGKLLGLGVHNDQIIAFKQTEREVVDLQSGTQGIRPCDMVSERSLVQTPHGLAWAGERGIYLLPVGYEQETVLNAEWQNLYDGTLMATGTTPFVTASARRAIVGGYDPNNDALFFVLLLNKSNGGTEYVAFVYSFKKRPLSDSVIGWYQRKFNIGSDGSIAYFSSRQSDTSLTIGYASGVLKYPNRSGSYLYQDDVLINGASTQISQSKGIPTKLKIMLGSLYGFARKVVYEDVKIDFSGESISGTGAFNVLFYMNKATSAFSTLTQKIDSLMARRKVKPVGAVERMSIEINFTEDAESDLKKFDISAIDINAHQEESIVGNT